LKLIIPEELPRKRRYKTGATDKGYREGCIRIRSLFTDSERPWCVSVCGDVGVYKSRDIMTIAMVMVMMRGSSSKIDSWLCTLCG